MRVECYDFDLGEGNHVRLNNSNTVVTVAAHDYLPVEMSRGEIEGDIGKGEQEVEVKFPRRSGGEMVDYLEDLAGGRVDLIIISVDPDFTADAATIFQGAVEELFSDEITVGVTVKSQYARKATSSARLAVMPGCILELFSDRCSASDTDFQIYGTISSISLDTPTHISFAVSGSGSMMPTTPAADYFKLGRIVARRENRMIVSSVLDATEVALVVKLSGKVEVGEPFVAYAGCDRKQTTCRDKFSNYPNFLGFPYAPYEDTIFVGRKGEFEAGGKK